MPRNINTLAPCLGQRQVIRGNPLYQPPHGPAKASGRSGAQLRGPVERTSIPSPPLASTHRLSRRWHGERPPTMRTTPALLLLAACCDPIPPTDPSASPGGYLVTSSTGSDSMGVSSEIGSVSAPPDDATSAGSSSDTSAGSTSTGQVTTSASSGGDSSTSGATTGGEGGSSSGGSEPCGGQMGGQTARSENRPQPAAFPYQHDRFARRLVGALRAA